MEVARWFLAIGLALLPALGAVDPQQAAPPAVHKTQPANASPHAKVTNPHGPIKMACQDCHTYTSWKPIRAIPEFNHDNTSYPLRGMHQKVGCSQCHTSLVFRNVSKHCADCHADIHRRKFSSNCESCHSVKGWEVSLKEIQNHQNRFPLVGAHAMVDCQSCHKGAATGQFQGLSTACFSCHQKDYETPLFDHVSFKFPTTCESCHSMNSWLGAKFDHLAITGFALTGMHATLQCSSCHINNKFKGTPADCFSCHQTAFVGTNNPSHVQLGLPHDCGTCHTTLNWLNAKFDHTIYTKYPLTWMHKNVACEQCHVGGKYAGTPTACSSCHLTNYNATTNPNHAKMQFPTTCELCHSTAGWIPSSFDHSKTKFPLTGLHAQVRCAQCHTNSQFANTPTDCYACHQTDFNKTTNPPHVSGGFPTGCAVCHTTSGWIPASFDHSKSQFPLTGAHTTVKCALCHANNNYTTLPLDCAGCHMPQFTQTTKPNHVVGGFPTGCAVCHTTVAWIPSSFNHAVAFPLTGAHATVQCALCHISNNYTTLPKDCFGCHVANFMKTTKPGHVAAGFPTNCTMCHTTVAWVPSSFNHSVGAFPLTGAHTTVQCASCHVANNYTTLPVDCYSCHVTNFNGTTNPNHIQAAFPRTCTICHTTVNWTQITFNHATYTKFPLTGMHANLACAQCHIGGKYTGTPADCYSCHTKDYNGTKNPNHPASGYPTDCSICHSTVGWSPSTFDHSRTIFPLTGAHTSVTCALCHVNNNFTTVPTDCFSCHAANYNSTTNPNHKTAQFPTTCATCHTTVSWAGAVFDHSKTPFPLTGAHVTVGCTQCHINNVFVGTPTDCYACHKPQYLATTNPNHTTAGFPTTCATCHTTVTWSGAVFNHTWFNVNHGSANGVCATCHTNSANYAVFTCTNCHQKSDTDSHHSGVNGYVYNSVNCYACHKNSGGGGGMY